MSLITIIAAFKLSPDASKVKLLISDKPDLINAEDIINTVQKPDISPPKTPEPIEASTDKNINEPEYSGTEWEENDPFLRCPLLLLKIFRKKFRYLFDQR